MLPMVGLLVAAMTQVTPVAAQEELSSVVEVQETASAEAQREAAAREAEAQAEETSETTEAPETEIRGWATIQGLGKVYITDEGLFTGLQEIDGTLYLFDDNGALCTDNQWVETERGWVFVNAQGEVYRDQLIYFGPDVKQETEKDTALKTPLREEETILADAASEVDLPLADDNRLEREESESASDAEEASQTVTFGPQVAYYLDHDGSIATGFRQVQDELMYFNEDGTRNHANQWVETERGRVFVNADGVVYTNQFITFGSDTSYYVGEDGAVISGMVEADGTVYRMTGEEGQRLIESSAYEYEGKDYFADAEGYPYRDRIVTVDGKDYYYGEDGAKVCEDFTMGDYEYSVDSASGEILSVDEIIKEPIAPCLYSLSDFRFQGVVYWSGYKFTYYSQSVLPGSGLRIPGRHVNDAGFVADGDGYIVLANDAPKGTIIPTPFGCYGKVYDRGTSGNHFDVYTR